MSSYTKKQIYNIIKKLNYMLKTRSVDIVLKRKQRNYYGEYKPDTDTIEIDFRRDIIPTLIHECLHKWYPDWCESKVEQHEKHIINSITAKQVKNIMKMLVTYL